MKKIRKPITLDPEIVKYVDKKRSEQNRSFSGMVNHLLTEAVLAEKIKKG